MFRFATPEYFYLLILVPVLIGVYWYSVRVRRRALERFGDPETQPVLSLLKTDLLDVMMACSNGTLDQLNVTWSDGAACCIVMASGGYPMDYQKGYPISGLDSVDEDVFIYHAGTKFREGTYLTNGGRVLGVTATADDLESAIAKAYHAVEGISFQDAHYRTDIGRK